MPYRRLPKTDTARLKALKTVLENNNVYTVQNRFIDWKTLNRAQPAYDRLLTACQQYKVRMAAQTRHSPKMENLMRNATMYVSHFIQVLLMSIERGEMKRSTLPLYGMSETQTAVPSLKAAESVITWGEKIVEGEKTCKNGWSSNLQPHDRHGFYSSRYFPRALWLTEDIARTVGKGS